MWASDRVYFLGFLCPAQLPQSRALFSVPSWKFLFSWTGQGLARGGEGCPDCPCWAHLIPPGLTTDGLSCYINIYFSPALPPPPFWHFTRLPQSQAVLCRLCLCEIPLCLEGAVTQSDLEKPPPSLLFQAARAGLPIFMCAFVKSRIHEAQLGYPSATRLYCTLRAAHSMPIFWLCCVTGRRLFTVGSISEAGTKWPGRKVRRYSLTKTE